MEALKIGERLVKKRGGLRKKVEVVDVRSERGVPQFATLKPLAMERSDSVRSVVVPIGEDGLPHGYQREVAT